MAKTTIKKPPKTGPSRATTLILTLLVIMVALYAAVQIAGQLNTPYRVMRAYYYEADDETAFSGYVVRQETVLPSQEGGVLDLNRSEGERVGKGQRLATVYADSSAVDRETELDTLYAQRDQLDFALEQSSGATVAVKLDSSIQSGIFSMLTNLNSRQYSALEQDVSSVEALVIKRDYSAGGADAEALQTQRDEVQQRIDTLEAQQERNARAVSAPVSGIFSAVVDGYETVLTPAALETMTPRQLAGVQADGSVSSNVGKLITGGTWYYAANMDEQTAAAYKVGSTVTLRFVKELSRDLTMTVYRVSDSEDGQKLVVFSCDEYLSEVTLLRRQTANVIHASYSGIRVPTEALRVEDGVTGVYCLVGMQAVFKPVDVVYQGDKYYLVEPAKLADDTENTSSSRLREGDSVLITAMELYDGKVLEA